MFRIVHDLLPLYPNPDFPKPNSTPQQTPKFRLVQNSTPDLEAQLGVTQCPFKYKGTRILQS